MDARLQDSSNISNYDANEHFQKQLFVYQPDR